MKLHDLIEKFKKWPLTAQMITIIIPIFFVLVLISIILFGPTFSFVEHHMSTLGNQRWNPNGFFFLFCLYYNGSVIVSLLLWNKGMEN